MAREPAAEDASARERKAILRFPAVAMLAIALLTVCVTPIALTVPGMAVLYLFPIAAAYWVLRVRTTAAASGLTVRTLFGTRELPWSELTGLALGNRGKVSAVTTNGEKILLPTVRARHLPVLSLVSNGRLADPSGVTSGERPERAGKGGTAADAVPATNTEPATNAEEAREAATGEE